MRFGVVLILMVAPILHAQFGGLGGGTSPIPTSDAASSAASTGFKPWLSANGYYSRILGDQALPSGIMREQLYPAFAGGIGGWKSWNNRNFGANYSGSGSTRNYSTDSTAPSWQQNHVGTLGYSQQVNQRLSFSVSEALGKTYGGLGNGSAYGATGAPGLSSSFGPGAGANDILSGLSSGISQNGIVDNEFFDSKVTFSMTSGNVGYLLSMRTKISAFGEVAFVRRASRNYDQRVFGGGGSITHRVSRTMELGGGYERMETRYPNVFGGVTSNSGYTTFRVDLTPHTVFTASAGVGLLNSTFVGSVAIDPAIAEIIGSGSILQVTTTRFMTPVFNGNLSQAFKVGTFTLNAGRGINPGNGVVYAGVRDTGSVSFSRPIGDRIGLSAVGSYYRMSGRVGTLAVNQSTQGSGMLSVKIVHSVSFTMQAGVRATKSAENYNRKELFGGIGLVWQPADHAFIF